jgi:hypothetical protein
MERISQYLEVQSTPASTRAIEEDVEGAREWKRKALKLLVNEGYVTTEEGKQRAILHRSKKPYRASNDQSAPSAPKCAESAPRALQKSSAPVRRPYVVGQAHSARTLDDTGEPQSAPEYEPPDEYYESITDIN